jgi:uncharacterized integral membrane protein (TIGR00697 family)
MLRTDFGRYKYLGMLAILSVIFNVITNVIGARLVIFGGASVSVSVYTFPMFFLLSDILTEVYGYAQARNVLWISISARVLAGVVIWLTLLIPASPIFKDEAAYQLVLSSGLRMAAAGIVAGWAGDIFNSYILAKMKIWNKGNHMWLRFTGSTFLGEIVNSLAFFSIAFVGKMPIDALFYGMAMSCLAKTLWEIIALPITYPVVKWLKKVEGIDHYDRRTDFNPFITDAD